MKIRIMKFKNQKELKNVVLSFIKRGICFATLSRCELLLLTDYNINMISNNPLNIRYSKKNHWLGQIGQCRGFVKFDTFTHGVRASIVLLKNYYCIHHLRTISDIIRRYAPNSENDTDAYIRFVSRRANLGPCEPLSLEQVFFDMLPAMAIYESNTTLPHDVISFVLYTQNINLFNNEKG